MHELATQVPGKILLCLVRVGHMHMIENHGSEEGKPT